MLLSAAVSVVTVWAAIALSFVSDWPVGFFVGGLSALAYGAGRIWTWMPHLRASLQTAA
jgi:zinc/manganese transport system permease protein